MLGVTLTPTMAEAGKKANVIPSEAEALIDCRVPPGFGKDEARERLEALIGDGDYEIEFSEAVVGNSSPMDSPLRGRDPLLARRGGSRRGDRADGDAWIQRQQPVPHGLPRRGRLRLLSAIARSDLFQAAPLIHGADERVPVSDVELSARFFYELSQRMLS